ncbi:hypothetical protein Val02_08120 [Virgisporangium aliadipatigenens]|uniref:DUF4352 domain-containing protein n=1 Tax=Virgisporangium aliadipatigenens TaxID=741659 RepID=A0A8J3YH96_9ACTN|nr:hypothetical protein Val02_08120 [Virgisporangium aliadipatigenens]
MIVLGAGVALGGCGDDESPTATAPATRPVSGSPSGSGPPGSPAASAKAEAPPQIGTPLSVAEWSGPLQVTVFEYKQPLSAKPPTPKTAGHQFAAIDVRTCNRTTSLVQVIDTKPFTLVFGDTSTVAAYGFDNPAFPQPAYPREHSLAAGTCVRGWIVFDVPNSRPSAVRYSESEHSQGGGKTHDWPVV